MRRVIRRIARWYPKWWRERYGEEFDALLEDLPARPSAVLDVLKGACGMQLRTWNRARIAAATAIAGGAVALAAFLGISQSYRSEVLVAVRDARNGDSRVVISVVNRNRVAAEAADRELVSELLDQSLAGAIRRPSATGMIEILNGPKVSRTAFYPTIWWVFGPGLLSGAVLVAIGRKWHLVQRARAQ